MVCRYYNFSVAAHLKVVLLSDAVKPLKNLYALHLSGPNGNRVQFLSPTVEKGRKMSTKVSENRIVCLISVRHNIYSFVCVLKEVAFVTVSNGFST